MRLLPILSVLPMALGSAKDRPGVPMPLLGYAVTQPLGTNGPWSASMADAGRGEVCLIASASGHFWSLRDKFVWQLASPRRMTRIEVYADSVLVEDRDPERREEQWGVVILSDSLYDQISKWKHLTVVLKTSQYRTQRANIALDGFNALKPVFDSPTCTGR